MKKVMFVLLMMSLAVVLISCTEKSYDAVAVDTNVDKCAICNMQVSDDQFSAQLTTEDGQNFKFDDIGCMFKWKKSNPSIKIGAAYVRDFNDNDWINIKKATYVYDASFQSPMAYGVYAFKNTTTAESFLMEQGKGVVITAAEIDNHDWKQNMDGMDDMNMDAHDDASHAHE